VFTNQQSQNTEGLHDNVLAKITQRVQKANMRRYRPFLLPHVVLVLR